MINRPARVCLFGAAPDTGNLGVSALCQSALEMLPSRLPAVDVTVFDHGRGRRNAHTSVPDGSLDYTLLGAVRSRRYHRPENWWRIRASAWLGGLQNPAARCIRDADAILDISAGDSFTDLYGPRRFDAVMLPKRVALEHGKRLILLPQTYGPFEDPQRRRSAQAMLRGATVAWARDGRSFARLRELLGDRFDPARHRCGVDMAFGLTPRVPARRLPPRVAAWLSPDASVPTIGFNISGLVFNRPDIAARQYGIRADYRRVVHTFLLRVLRETDANVLLTPHVLTPTGSPESDTAACVAVARSLVKRYRGRVAIIPPRYNAAEMKWIIGRTAWFCGMRMHATIAALSSGVPTAAIAYSGKTLGVFETVGQGAHVHDARELATDELVERLCASLVVHASTSDDLKRRLPAVRAAIRAQADSICAACVKGADVRAFAEAPA